MSASTFSFYRSLYFLPICLPRRSPPIDRALKLHGTPSTKMGDPQGTNDGNQLAKKKKKTRPRQDPARGPEFQSRALQRLLGGKKKKIIRRAARSASVPNRGRTEETKDAPNSKSPGTLSLRYFSFGRQRYTLNKQRIFFSFILFTLVFL